MTLSDNVGGGTGGLATSSSEILDVSTSNWDSIYCSHLWTNSHLRNAIINGNQIDSSKMIKYCYTCRGKIRKYEIKPTNDSFAPNNYSTPNGKNISNSLYANIEDATQRNVIGDIETSNIESSQHIPSISRQVESSFRHKYSSYEARPASVRRHGRLRKSLKGIGCVVSLALTDTPVKKRTQIQACSISVMIVAIVVISFVLVNFTSPNFKMNVVSSTAVPTQMSNTNETTLPVTDYNTVSQPQPEITTNNYYSTTGDIIIAVTENDSKLSDLIAKIRKNIKTYPKHFKKNNMVSDPGDETPKEINNRDLSVKFCSCQTDEVCMLDENSGTAICKKALDIDDPTGCGGLCALDTEACQLVDRARGVRVCRLLSLVSCSADQWRCRNGLCVDSAARCDGTIHCYDRSDEMYCDCDLTKQFRCGHSISCFSNSKMCDGAIDCWDGFDEVNCTTACPDEQFTCTDGQCIMSSRFCDGLADCGDGSDEPRGCGGGCGAREMRCGNQRCVPLAARCDGFDHCGDATDEHNCS